MVVAVAGIDGDKEKYKDMYPSNGCGFHWVLVLMKIQKKIRICIQWMWLSMDADIDRHKIMPACVQWKWLVCISNLHKSSRSLDYYRRTWRCSFRLLAGDTSNNFLFRKLYHKLRRRWLGRLVPSEPALGIPSSCTEYFSLQLLTGMDLFFLVLAFSRRAILVIWDLTLWLWLANKLAKKIVYLARMADKSPALFDYYAMNGR